MEKRWAWRGGAGRHDEGEDREKEGRAGHGCGSGEELGQEGDRIDDAGVGVGGAMVGGPLVAGPTVSVDGRSTVYSIHEQPNLSSHVRHPNTAG